ncbi:MAG: hypothetical protein VXV96_09190 [Bdellovibrionota bacterium]|nr:hypothetical protein [Bdellovibrionota bacterium]
MALKAVYLFEVFKSYSNILIPILSLTVALCSLFIGFFGHRRDKGVFRLNVYLGAMIGRDSSGKRVKEEGNYLSMVVTNAGRRSLVATNVGADYKRDWLQTFKNLFQLKKTPIVSIQFDEPAFWNLVMTPTGEKMEDYTKRENMR